MLVFMDFMQLYFGFGTRLSPVTYHQTNNMFLSRKHHLTRKAQATLQGKDTQKRNVTVFFIAMTLSPILLGILP